MRGAARELVARGVEELHAQSAREAEAAVVHRALVHAHDEAAKPLVQRAADQLARAARGSVAGKGARGGLRGRRGFYDGKLAAQHRVFGPDLARAVGRGYLRAPKRAVARCDERAREARPAAAHGHGHELDALEVLARGERQKLDRVHGGEAFLVILRREQQFDALAHGAAPAARVRHGEAVERAVPARDAAVLLDGSVIGKPLHALEAVVLDVRARVREIHAYGRVLVYGGKDPAHLLVLAAHEHREEDIPAAVRARFDEKRVVAAVYLQALELGEREHGEDFLVYHAGELPFGQLRHGREADAEAEFRDLHQYSPFM